MSSFSLDVARFAEIAGDNTEQVVKKATIDLFTDVVRGTPVEKGRARGNWQPTIDAPAVTVLEAYDPSGAATIGKVAGAVSAGSMGDTFHMTNNLPYIERLEMGYSKQAPAGMVRLNVERWQQMIDGASVEVGE